MRHPGAEPTGSGSPIATSLAALLLAGHPVRDIVAASRYRESYVHLLLKQIYKKLGQSGQAALVRRILVMDALPRR